MSYNPEEELKEFPCTFTLVPASKVTNERYKHLENNLREDLLNGDCLEDEETIWNKNLLAWVMFCLGEKEESFKLSQENLRATDEKNITALGNFVYISFRMSDNVRSEDGMKKLKALSTQGNFQTLKTEALAEQAYALSRLGGLKNPLKSKELYKKCLEECPKNLLWKYGLGLVCRRLTKMDLSMENVENIDMTELRGECVKLLFDVAEHANSDNLKGLAYSQLVTIRKYNVEPEHDSLFKWHTVPQLCSKALKFGRKNPVVMTQSGRSLKRFNIDDAINLLERSLSLREDNTAYSHLGLCLHRKAIMIAKGTYSPKDSLLKIKEGTNTRRRRDFQNETSKRADFGEESSSDRRWQKKYSLKDLNFFIYNEYITLSQDDELVKKAIECFKRAQEMSYGENVSATICFGKIFFNTGKYKDALAQFNQVIYRNDNAALVCLVDASNGARKCLKYLSGNSENRKLLAEEANAKFISLAADLVAKKPNEINIDELISDAINIFSEDTAPIKNKEIGNTDHDSEANSNIANEEKKMAFQEPDNMCTVLKKLTGFLESGLFEKALAYLSYQSTKSSLLKETMTSEIRDMWTNVYTGAAWSRLKNLSPDCMRAFQKLFQIKYGHCKGMVDKMEEGELNRHNVLIIDNSKITNHGDRSSKRLCRNLLFVLNIVCGLKTSHHLKLTDDQGLCSEELNVQSMLKFSLIVIIVESPISEDYRHIFKTLSQWNGPKIIIINCGMIHECPSSPEGGSFVELNASSEPLTKLLTRTIDEEEFGLKQYEQSKLFLKRIVENLFDGSPDAVMRLFCLLVGEDFDERREYWAVDSMSSATPD